MLYKYVVQICGKFFSPLDFLTNLVMAYSYSITQLLSNRQDKGYHVLHQKHVMPTDCIFPSYCSYSVRGSCKTLGGKHYPPTSACKRSHMPLTD